MLKNWVILAVSVILASIITQAVGLGFRATYGSLDEIARLFLTVAVLAFLNVTLGKILKLLTLPLNCLTMGLFSFVINAAILALVASLSWGFTITGEGWKGFFAALIASILITGINGALGGLTAKKEKDD